MSVFDQRVESPTMKTPNVLSAFAVKVSIIFSTSFYIKVPMSILPFLTCQKFCPVYQIRNLDLKSWKVIKNNFIQCKLTFLLSKWTSTLSQVIFYLRYLFYQVKTKCTENLHNSNYLVLYRAIILLAPSIPILKAFPAGNCMFKVNNRNTRTRCEICSKLTIKTPERR